MSDLIDLTGMTIGEWDVQYYMGNGRFWCKCSCGVEKSVDAHELRRGGSKSCGHDRLDTNNLYNKEFGEWTAIKPDPNKKRYWICKCSCGAVKSVHSYSLLHGKSKSCGHDTCSLKDLTNRDFGDWHVDSYAGNGQWNCTCSCGTKRKIDGTSLRLNRTKSCGCKTSINTRKSKIEIYGDYNYKNTREAWQIATITDKDRLEQFILGMVEDKGRKVSNQEIADELGVTRTAIYEATKKFDITGYSPEDWYLPLKIQQNKVAEHIESIYDKEIIKETRSMIPPQELDIYLPDIKLAIEYNGLYWHSTERKHRLYHQNKTIECAKQGIRLIHIFEYEWKNEVKQQKIKELLRNAVGDKSIKTIYARNTEIHKIASHDANEFIDRYHLSGSLNSEINLGCFYEKELIGVMTFGIPRFNKEYDYELLRLCWKSGLKVIGGTDKLFKYFIRNHEFNSIITFSDITKFTGNVYTRLGFKPAGNNPITEPNYVWVNCSNKVLSRYQTQKHKLIAQGLGKKDDTEDSIMKSHGYLKTYDSGNIRLEYIRG